jgi:prolyl-tRNA editing enzyme YbaK/EbsC (Cys-tRNA(Pro) deacylase)
MRFGNLEFIPIDKSSELIGVPVKESIRQHKLEEVLISEIDPNVSDTSAFCEKYDIGLDVSVNCVIVQAKRADKLWYAAILIPATERADINGIVRKTLDARKISFAPQETAVELTKMEFGAITPIGLPSEWPILVDDDVAKLDKAIIGSGVRKSKLLVSGKLLASLPNAKVLSLTKMQSN